MRRSHPTAGAPSTTELDSCSSLKVGKSLVRQAPLWVAGASRDQSVIRPLMPEGRQRVTEARSAGFKQELQGVASNIASREMPEC